MLGLSAELGRVGKVSRLWVSLGCAVGAGVGPCPQVQVEPGEPVLCWGMSKDHTSGPAGLRVESFEEEEGGSPVLRGAAGGGPVGVSGVAIFDALVGAFF